MEFFFCFYRSGFEFDGLFVPVECLGPWEVREWTLRHLRLLAPHKKPKPYQTIPYHAVPYFDHTRRPNYYGVPYYDHTRRPNYYGVQYHTSPCLRRSHTTTLCSNKPNHTLPHNRPILCHIRTKTAKSYQTYHTIGQTIPHHTMSKFLPTAPY